MGLFDFIFGKSVHEKYMGLIGALREYYQPLHITKVTNSVFSMSADHCRNLGNLIITIYKGSAYDEYPEEYKDLNYNNYVFVKTSYSINGESVTIRNAFPKNGNQVMMFTSIIAAEGIKTNYELEVQHQKEIAKKKAEEERIKKEQERLQKLKGIRQEIEDSCQEELSETQKIALISYLCYFTGDTHRNKLKYCMLFNADISKIESLDSVRENTSSFTKLLLKGVNSYETIGCYLPQATLISVRNRNAVYTFIHYCSNSCKKELFVNILKEWGFQNFEIEEFIECPPTLPEIEVIEDIFNPTDISSRQKIALSIILKLLVLQIPTSSVKISIVKIIDSYRKILGIPSDTTDWAEQNLLESNRDYYIQLINTIWEVSYIEVFLFVGINIIKLTKYNNLVVQYFKEIIKSLSSIQDATQVISSRKFNYEWESYKKDLEVIGIQTAKITQTWSLLEFAREFGKMQLVTFNQEEYDIPHKMCVFTLNRNRTFVYFSSRIGELTAQEIKDKKYQLKVKLLSNGNYFLYE
mgnify:CR=1 FL=1